MTAEENEFLDLIRTMKARILRICRNYASDGRLTCQDLFQEVMFNLWKSYRSFRGESSRETWVYRITLYTCMQHYRRMKRSENVLKDLPHQTDDSDENTGEMEIALHRSVRELGEPDRAIMILYLENRTYEEIASITGLTVSNTGVRINRAKEKLKKIMEGYGY